MKVAWLLVAVLLAGQAPAVHAQIPLPRLEARVTDLTGTLTAAQQSALEDKLAAFEARKGAQIECLSHRHRTKTLPSVFVYSSHKLGH
jgi:uncharacterized protein